MDLTFLETVILYCLSRLNGERTIYSIYHLLQGKKSSQTIQDAHLFEVGIFFRTYPQLTRDQLEQIVADFHASNYVVQHSEQHYKLTDNGYARLRFQLSITPIPEYLNGWKFHQLTNTFWERLSLVTQVASNLSRNNTSYIPIQKNKEVLEWLKQFLTMSQRNRKELAEQLHKEYISALNTLENDEAAILIIRLTGYNRIGLTASQAADTLHMEYTKYHFQFINILHKMIHQIISSRELYPLFSIMISAKEETVPITHSTKRTLDLLQKGYCNSEIAVMRKLKESTIEDHLVEIAINMKNFDVSPYVDDKKKQSILSAMKQSPSRQLKHIRQIVPDATYFQIRLVIAKYGEEQ